MCWRLFAPSVMTVRRGREAPDCVVASVLIRSTVDSTSPPYPGENVGLRAGSLQTPDEQLEVTASSAASPVNEAAVDGHRPVCARAVQRNHGLRDNDLVDSRANAQRPIADRPVIHFVADREKLPHHCGRLPIRHLCRQARLEGLQLRRRTLGDDGPQWPKRHIQEERWMTLTRDDARAA